jgi:hypothetical protein
VRRIANQMARNNSLFTKVYSRPVRELSESFCSGSNDKDPKTVTPLAPSDAKLCLYIFYLSYPSSVGRATDS